MNGLLRLVFEQWRKSAIGYKTKGRQIVGWFHNKSCGASFQFGRVGQKLIFRARLRIDIMYPAECALQVSQLGFLVQQNL
jgi:hypothetical protein